MKKTILTLAIIAILPLTAMAENISGAMYVAPATETQNTPAPETNADAPYGRINIDTDDREHVASTAYVKGAYNSAIAAVNKTANSLTNDINDKQDQLEVNGSPINTNVVGSDTLEENQFASIYDGLNLQFLMLEDDPEGYESIKDNALEEAFVGEDPDSMLVTFGGALDLINDTAGAAVRALQIHKQQKLTTTVNNRSQNISSTVAQTVNTANPSATTLVSEAAIASAISGQATALNNKRVKIYTTWNNDTDNATQLVEFATASNN